MNEVFTSLASTWLEYRALQISTILSGSRRKPFSARVAATSWVCSTRKPFAADTCSTAVTTSSNFLSLVTVSSNTFMTFLLWWPCHTSWARLPHMVRWHDLSRVEAHGDTG